MHVTLIVESNLDISVLAKLVFASVINIDISFLQKACITHFFFLENISIETRFLGYNSMIVIG
jgi:hypothetical protein